MRFITEKLKSRLMAAVVEQLEYRRLLSGDFPVTSTEWGAPSLASQEVTIGPVDVQYDKLSSSYKTVLDSVREGIPTSYQYRLDEMNRLETYIYTEADSVSETEELLTRIGAKVGKSVPSSRLISAWVPLDQITALTLSAFTASISLPDYVINDQTPAGETKPRELQVSDSLWRASIAKSRILSEAEGARVDSADRIQVYIYTTDQTSQSIEKSIVEADGVVDIVSSSGVIQAWLPTTAISAASEWEGVSFISLPDYVVSNTGTVNTAGDALLEADTARSTFLATGSGVKVGVISNGADHRSSVGDNLGSVTVDPARPGTGDEGTAMLEIVRDLAPSASLYFSGPATSIELVSSIEWLVDQGCQIIVDDVSAYGEPYFQDGAVAAAAQAAINANVTYVSAAGNASSPVNQPGITHYQADFSGSTVHDFDVTSAVDNRRDMTMSPGNTLRVYLQWSDPFGASSNDYNLELVDSTGSVLVPSATIQNGNDNPSEFIVYTNTTGVNKTVGIRVTKAAGAAVREMEIFTTNVSGSSYANQYITTYDTLIAQRAIPGVITVAAIDASDAGTDTVESFSSRGASTIYTNFSTQTSTVRNTLDVAGIDGVQTRVGQLGYFSNPFFGTSAAAPHVAGVAALMLSANPALTPAELQDDLQLSSDDIAGAGYDQDSGFGRVDATQALVRSLVTESGSVISIKGTAGNDTIVASLGGSTLTVTHNGITQNFDATGITGLNVDSADGNDTITISSSVTLATTLSGGNDYDIISGGSGIDYIIGGAGNDSLTGGLGNDSLTGGQGDDVLGGGKGNDSLTGGDGNDNLTGGDGNDTYTFGNTSFAQTDTVIETGTAPDADVLDFSGSTGAVDVDLAVDSGIATMANRTISTGAAGQAAYFENVQGSTVNDTISGNASANSLLGNGGDDSLFGLAGNDTLGGGQGNDFLGGSTGNDSLTGGSGSDSINGGGDSDVVQAVDSTLDTLDGGLGTDIAYRDPSLDITSNFETLA